MVLAECIPEDLILPVGIGIPKILGCVFTVMGPDHLSELIGRKHTDTVVIGLVREGAAVIKSQRLILGSPFGRNNHITVRSPYAINGCGRGILLYRYVLNIILHN